MFKPSSDRLDYSELMTPPFGYATEFAVGTTYSLDFDALIGVCLALGLSESIDSDLKDNPIYLLEALQKVSNKVIIFCEKGQIKVPANASALYILLEKMVVEVTLKNKKSFHPKFWIVKYTALDGNSIFRLITMSRNLTFDRSWDIAVTLEGTASEVEDIRSVPIFDFLIFLTKHIDKNSSVNDKKSTMIKMAKALLNVDFKLDGQKFIDYEFMPLGIKGYEAMNTGLFGTYHEMVVISPFLSLRLMETFNKNLLTHKEKQCLITRRSELRKLKSGAVSEFDIYVLKDTIVDGEESISESAMNQQDNSAYQPTKQDIHAKLYLQTKDANSALYVGSANASHNAFYGNIEFLLILKGKRRYLNVDSLKADLFGLNEKENPFEIVVLKDENELEDVGIDLEKVLKELCRFEAKGRVEKEDDKYNVIIAYQKLDLFDFEGSIHIRPFLSNQSMHLSDTVTFKQLDLLKLSEFYVIMLEHEGNTLSRLVRIPMKDMPIEREQSLVKSIIKNTDGFVQYLSFLLEGDYLIASILSKREGHEAGKFNSGNRLPALYEKLLKSTVNSPEKFRDIERLISMIGDDDIIPEGFKTLYETFQKAVNQR